MAVNTVALSALDLRDDPASQTSFGRGLRVLVHVAERGEARAEDLAASLQIPLSTVYRYLRSLRSFELVEENDGTYVAGARLLQLSGQHLAHSRLAELAGSVLTSVVDRAGETAVLTVRVGHEALCLRQVESPQHLRYAFSINQLLPLYAGAGQRVLLAFAPLSVVSHVLGQPMRRFTDHTLTDRELRAELKQIRRTGVAESHGELNSGAVAIAMPVTYRGDVVCSLALAGVEERCTDQWQADARKILLEATASLTRAVDDGAASAQDERSGDDQPLRHSCRP